MKCILNGNAWNFYMNENTFYNLFLNFESINNKGEQSNKNVVPTRHCNPAENYLLRIQSKTYQQGNWKNIEFPLERKKYMTSQVLYLTLHFEGRTRYFRHTNPIRVSINKMDSKHYKSHQNSLEKISSCSDWIQLWILMKP